MEIVTFGNFTPDWLGDPATALVAIMLVSIWASVGFQMVILLAALQDVPVTLYEAARLDGANTWQQVRNVTLPGIRNQLLFVLTITTILSFRLFDQVWIMPDRPGGPLDSTRTLMVDIVDTGVFDGNIGRGSALSVVFLAIVLVITFVQRRLIKQEGEVR
jgi:multiple sugar transport system permease protein